MGLFVVELALSTFEVLYVRAIQIFSLLLLLLLFSLIHKFLCHFYGLDLFVFIIVGRRPKTATCFLHFCRGSCAALVHSANERLVHSLNFVVYFVTTVEDCAT